MARRAAPPSDGPVRADVVMAARNQEKARERFGADFIARKIAERRAKTANDAHHTAGKSEAKVVPAPEVATSVEGESPMVTSGEGTAFVT